MTAEDAELAALAETTQTVYERNAGRFDAERPKGLHERIWLDRFLAQVPAGGAILDLGCGAGDPIAGYIMGRGYSVIGIDSSSAMLAIARARYPAGDWRQADMRRLNLGETFHGIIAWDSFFHLRPDEQRSVLPLMAAHLAASGALLLSVGPEAGETVGRVGDDSVYHASLAPQEYRTRLDHLGIDILRFVAEDPDCDFRTLLLARKRDRDA